LAEIKEYNFLGNIIDNKGRFKRSVQELSKKGLKAFFSLKKILIRIFNSDFAEILQDVFLIPRTALQNL
jgi:hypothetical protein